MADLARSEERLRQALDANRCGIWEWDIARDLVTWSDRIHEFHGVAPTDFDGRIESFVRLIHPEDRPRVETALRRALEQKEPFSVEFRPQRPDGELRWLSTNARTFFGEQARSGLGDARAGAGDERDLACESVQWNSPGKCFFKNASVSATQRSGR